MFVMPGLEVLDYSTPTHIILNNVISDTSGVFKCEVSAGPPRFSTASRTTHLQIVGMQGNLLCATLKKNFSPDLPTSRPHIYGLRSSYGVGSVLNLTCESGPSSPPTTLLWFINGEKLPHNSPFITEMEAVYPLANKRAISRSLLTLRLTEDRIPHHPHPFMVKCVAVIREFYRKSVKSRVKVVGRKEVINKVVEMVEDKTTESFMSSRGEVKKLYVTINYLLLLLLLCY